MSQTSERFFRDRNAAAQACARIEKQLPPGLYQTFLTLVGEVPDPDSAVNLLDRLLGSGTQEVLPLFEQTPALLHYALVVFGYSSYLGETLIHNHDLLRSLRRQGILDRSHSAEDFRESFARFRSRSFEVETALLLARFKRREYVRIMLRDVLGIATLAETTAEISALTDVLIEEALREAESNLRNRYGAPQHRDATGRLVDTSCAVLSLGKLGGNELNYSSDIDLLFLYDDGPKQMEGGESDALTNGELDNREWFIRLAQNVSEVLSRMTSEGFVFRVDLRLRPQGGEGEPAVGLRHATRYYAETAHDWERQALIKVRHSAGDLALSRALIRGIQPFVYLPPAEAAQFASDLEPQAEFPLASVKRFNFVAIETALETRDRISRRRKVVARSQSIDVKLDRGGIRDIEFLVQCLQRVYGGAESWLRSGGTLFSLAKLHDKGHISGKDFHELTTAYEFLRTLEHRLQLRHGQQTHRIPQSEAEREVISRALRAPKAGEVIAPDLVSAVRQRMNAVAEIYGRIIYQQKSQQQAETGDSNSRSSFLDLSAERSERQLLQQLATDAPQVYHAMSREDVASHTRRNLLRFLASAATSAERYSVVTSSPEALMRALDIFRFSDFLTDILARYPEEIAVLKHIHSRSDRSSEAESKPDGSPEMLLSWIASGALPANERQTLLRTHYRRCVFSSGARDVLEHRNVYSSLLETSAAADAAIASALAIGGQSDGFAILALGRLGTHEFDLLSDADLLFVREESLDSETARRIAEQVVHTLSAYTREGTVFPVDARLRPRGGAGDLVMTPVQLASYFQTEAQPWEALLFTKLRTIAGDQAVAARALGQIDVLISRFALDAGFVDAVREMRTRIENAGLARSGYEEVHTYDRSLKSGPGGIYDADFIVGALTVLHGLQDDQGNVIRGNLRDRLCSLEARKLISSRDGEELRQATEFLRSMDHAIRLSTGRKTLLASEQIRHSTAELASRFLGGTVSRDIFEELAEVRTKMRSIYERVMGSLQ